MTREALYKMQIKAVDRQMEVCIQKRWDRIAKPLDGLGCFEHLLARIGAIAGSQEISLSHKAVLVFCADNGIVEEKVSQSGQEVTAAVAINMVNGQSSVCRMAQQIGAQVKVIDVGIRQEMQSYDLIHAKIAYGTKNFRKEPAMSEQEACQAILTGMQLVEQCRQEGFSILAMGEMGIGNTTTSSAVAAALLGCSAAKVTGRGAGLNDAGIQWKRQLIDEAVQKYQLNKADPLTVLAAVGGFDIAALAGMCIGGAVYRMPIVMDGVISAVAALAAERIVPGTREYLIPSHCSREPAARRLLAELGLRPVLDADMALGEGTGAVMMLGLLEMALCVYQQQNRFEQIGIEPYQRF